MIICVIVACLLAFCSIFANFGPAYVLETSIGNASINMFDYMLGTNNATRYPALTWLFSCEIIIMVIVIAMVVLYVLAKNKKDKDAVVLCGSGALAALSLAGGVTSFCTMSILGISTSSGIYASVKMGAGSIITGLMLLLAFVAFVAYIALALVKKLKK